MSIANQITSNKLYMGKLAHGKDLLVELTDFCKEEDITLGRVSAIGAVQKACIGYYDQNTRAYQYIDLDQHLEIANLTGNVSQKGGDIMVHVHVTFADAEGKAYGGHLAPGTTVFACEFIVEAFSGPVFNRGLDTETGLPLWEL